MKARLCLAAVGHAKALGGANMDMLRGGRNQNALITLTAESTLPPTTAPKYAPTELTEQQSLQSSSSSAMSPTSIRVIGLAVTVVNIVLVLAVVVARQRTPQKEKDEQVHLIIKMLNQIKQSTQ